MVACLALESFAQATCLCSGGQMNATPFCTNENPYGLTYSAGTSGYASELYYLNSTGCIDPYSGGPNPAWFKMRISSPGNLTIFLNHTGGGDIDYACWGPFTDADMANMCAGYPYSLNSYLYDNLISDYYYDYYNASYYLSTPLQIFSHHPTYVDYNYYSETYGDSWTTDWYNPNPSGRLVDCSATPSPTEYIHIRNAQVGQWYIVLISNWEGISGNINFSSDASSVAQTDCTITSPVTGDEVCEGETATLTAQSAAGAIYYTWTFPNGTTQNTSTNTLTIPNVTLASAGTYSMQVWNGTMYGQTTQCELIVHEAPNLSVTSASVCTDESATITASGAETYLWNTGATTASMTVRPLETTTYTVTGTSGGMCTATASATVTVNPTYEVEWSDTICQGETYNQNGFVINADTPGTTDNVQNLQSAQGCDSIVTLHLTVLPAFVFEYDTAFCDGGALDFYGETYTQSGSYSHHLPTADGCDSVVTVHLTVNPNYDIEDSRVICKTELPYHYGPADTTFEEGTSPEGTYLFTRTTATGCDSNITLQLSVVDNYFETDEQIENFCEDRQGTLQVITELGNIFWNTGETTPEITVTRPGTYIVTAFTGNCRESAQFLVPRCDFDLFLPNAITPTNADGLNDYFCIPEATAQQISDVELYIYNRWGRLVFQSQDPFFHWDGSVNGKYMTNTTYTYRLSYRDFNGALQLVKGIITVL